MLVLTTVFPHMYSFRGNYSFLNFEIQRSQYINVQKLKGGNYMRKYGIHKKIHSDLPAEVIQKMIFHVNEASKLV